MYVVNVGRGLGNKGTKNVGSSEFDKDGRGMISMRWGEACDCNQKGKKD